jgi:serine/threonine protein kinase
MQGLVILAPMDIKNIGRYEIKKELGRGGMATVYLAFDPSFDREVAIKVLPREFLHNPQFLDRFQREIKTIAQLEHPSIVPVYDVGEHDGLPFFVMRYMPNGSLSDKIENGRLSLVDTARIVEKLASALSYAHRKGIVHRDLKPDNILFDEDNLPFISDFGIAKFSQAQTNLTGSGIIGTPAYMSPEQATGDTLDHRSDIYGLGVIVYQMLTGQQPYNADTPMGVAIKHVTDPVPEILSVAADLPSDVSEVMKTVLAKDREQRYPSAVEFARALNQVAFGNPGTIQESQPTIRLLEKAIPPNKKNLYIGGAIGAVVLVLLVVMIGRVFSNKSDNGASPVNSGEPTTLVEVTEALPSPEDQAAFAPACQPADAGPESLVALIKETNRDCRSGIPYTTFKVPKNTTFNVITPDFKCEIAATNKDSDVIICNGPQLLKFDVEFCNPLNAQQLVMNSDQCPVNAGYDEANQCCQPVPKGGPGCVIINTGTTGCN